MEDVHHPLDADKVDYLMRDSLHMVGGPGIGKTVLAVRASREQLKWILIALVLAHLSDIFVADGKEQARDLLQAWAREMLEVLRNLSNQPWLF